MQLAVVVEEEALAVAADAAPLVRTAGRRYPVAMRKDSDHHREIGEKERLYITYLNVGILNLTELCFTSCLVILFHRYEFLHRYKK